MEDFMVIPDEIIEIVDTDSLFLIKGGDEPITKVNNQGTMCDGINNQGACVLASTIKEAHAALPNHDSNVRDVILQRHP